MKSALVILLGLFVWGCGDNIQNPIPVSSLNPPINLKALSVTQSTVSLHWTAPSGSSDSTFRGYIAQVGSHRDTIAKATTTFIADNLPSLESTFLLYSLRSDGVRSNAAVIRWAPSTRFDSVYSVYESATLVSARPEGFNVGTTSTDPSVMIMNLNDPVVQQTIDIFFNGDSTETQHTLSIWSAHLRLATLNRTIFSSQTDVSPSLDFPLSAFPLENTFGLDNISVVDNTIYYAKVVGDPLQVNYVRLHLHIKAGTISPNRIIEVRVSLQRVPGLLYAFDSQEYPAVCCCSFVMHTLINRHHT